jgi:hypothetical protein
MRRVEFLVHVVQREGDSVFVGGRNCRDVVALGDILTVAGQDPPACEAKVRGILAYRRQMNRLDVGMTGELKLTVQGVDSIAKDCKLVGTFREPAPDPLVLGIGGLHVKSA